MRTFSWSIALILLLATRAWGAVAYPSDVAVSLTATPTQSLMAEQPIALTLAVTNNGPAPLDFVFVASSEFHTDFRLMTADCRIVTGILEVDGPATYLAYWVPTDDGPMQVGETRTCHVQMALTPRAAPVVAWTWGLLETDTDPVPANDRATVFLRRAIESVPLASPLALCIATWLLALVGWHALRLRRSTRHRSRNGELSEPSGGGVGLSRPPLPSL